MIEGNENNAKADLKIVDAYFYADLENIAIKQDLGEDIRISDNVFLSNSSTIREKIFHDKKDKLGPPLDLDNERNLLDWKPVYIYAFPEKGQRPHELIVKFLEIYGELEYVLISIWLLKDNCVNIYNACAKAIVAQKGELFAVTIPPHLGYPYISESKRDFGRLAISRSDIISIKEKYKLLSNIIYSNGVNAKMTDQGKPLNRLVKTLNFIKAARAQNDMSMKITHYISALECLFAKTPDELSYKLALRAASFLSKVQKERYNLFKTIRQAYKIRSKTVHGQKLKVTEKELKDISGAVDEILRRLLNIYIGDSTSRAIFELSAEKFDDYMDKLLFCIE